MCGICGFVGLASPGLIDRMTDTLGHRGPDDRGTFVDRDVALGHRRLSIIDLGGGHQPMHSADGRYVLVYNGEIYNYAELRTELVAHGATFQTESDTEVLLKLLEREGTSALHRLNGMFAFALFDTRERELLLARDRIGIKPLYYTVDRDRLLFASETKALLHEPEWNRELNPHALRDYLVLRYVPGPVTLFRHVERLPPGCFMRFRRGEARVERYWSPPEASASRAGDRSEAEYLEELEELMERSMRRRLIADVPVGAYLSGGLDSSVIAALMTRITSSSVKTFSVGFGYEHDELSEASRTAKVLGSDHHELSCRSEDVSSLLPEVVYHSDDPLGDAIAIPMFQLAREARKQVKVILTGEGADEIFGGYLFHKVMWGASLYRRLMPGGLRRGAIEPLAAALPARMLNLAFQYPAYLGDRGKLKAVDYLRTAGSGDQAAGYHHLISLFDDRELTSLFTPDFEASLAATPDWTMPNLSGGTEFDQMLRLQFEHWLADNMLLRNDKMSMASGIEGRVPFLDHELVEFGLRLPRSLKLRRLVGKYLLRRLAKRVLPVENARRRKMPFYVPIEKFFEEPSFISLMDDLLGERAVRARGIFRPEAIAGLRSSMHAHEFIPVKQVFSLMTLELWFRTFSDGGAASVQG